MNYKIIDKEKYYRKGVFNHFSKDCKCSVSITNRIDVTKNITIIDDILYATNINDNVNPVIKV